MEMKMEHFVAVSVCVICVLLLLLLVISLLLVQSARRHLRAGRPAPAAPGPGLGKPHSGGSMPRGLKMGTTPPSLCSSGKLALLAGSPPSSLYTGPPSPPDLLAGVGHSHSSDTSVASRDTVSRAFHLAS
jgi:hypothetical protein